MTYNPDKSKEQPTIPADTIVDGTVVKIDDGMVKDFVSDLTKWEGAGDSPAINVNIETKHNDNEYKVSKLFTYREENGATLYSSRSNLGKFKAKYGEIPKVGTKVKLMTDKDGFLRLKLD